MFIEDKAKVASRVGGVKCGVVYVVKLLFESDECEFGFGGIESQDISGGDTVAIPNRFGTYNIAISPDCCYGRPAQQIRPVYGRPM